MNLNKEQEAQKKVFIFDDNTMILELCTDILNDLNYEVKTSPTANNIELQVSEYMPDLIFMDNSLWGMSGIEATRLLKSNERLKDIPVVYFTANSNVSDLAEKAGADDHIAKPFDLFEFEKMVKKYL
ncbi:MAG: response regulator [Sphingobacteriales bacterium 41-5]|nr:MAG: response regulator receiver protein [Chryseobacterium sp. SCN 40-13]OJU28084.1 MAG: response regulator [Sphingobacteriales bacterium 41-5]